MTKLFAALVALSVTSAGAAMAAPAPHAQPASHEAAAAKPGAKPAVKPAGMKMKAKYVGHLKKLPRHHATKLTRKPAAPAKK
jgi:hypothetical protein